VRQPAAFKSERHRSSKPWYASQVDVNNDLSKPVTPHYLPKVQEAAVVKHHHVIASIKSRNNSKNMPRFSSNDMVHNHYLKEARKKTQKVVGIQDLNEVNSRAKAPSYKTTQRYKPEEQISIAKKPKRQIPTGHRFSIQKTFTVHEKTMTPRSCLRWKLTGRIFKTVSLRWVPTGKIFTSSITKKEQTLNLSARIPIDRDKIKALIIENVIAGRPSSYGITLKKATEISA
ncbi:hypothetical protein Tco_0825629, partial [Tanacetum coccineum]